MSARLSALRAIAYLLFNLFAYLLICLFEGEEEDARTVEGVPENAR